MVYWKHQAIVRVIEGSPIPLEAVYSSGSQPCRLWPDDRQHQKRGRPVPLRRPVGDPQSQLYLCGGG